MSEKELTKKQRELNVELDVWKADFAKNCLDIFGAPTSPASCLSSDEKYYFSYATICLALAMKENIAVWQGYLDDGVKPEDAAYNFAEFYQRNYGDTLVPLYKTASPAYEECSKDN